MKIKTGLQIGLGIAILSNVSMAGHGQGNGGDAVVCRDSGGLILTAELLDYYEARTMRGIERDLGPSDLSISEKLDLAFEDFSTNSPQYSIILKQLANSFNDNVIFLDNVTLTDIPDSNHVAIPDGCDVEQVAIQREPVFPEDKKYTIDLEIWNAFDNDNKAGLVLHELLYGMALDSDVLEEGIDSIGTRYINSLITARKTSSMTSKEFYYSLKNAGYIYLEVQGIAGIALMEMNGGYRPRRYDPTFFDDGSFKKITDPFRSYSIGHDTQVTITPTLPIPAQAVREISFYKNSTIRTIKLSLVGTFEILLDGVIYKFDETCDSHRDFIDGIPTNGGADLLFYHSGELAYACYKHRQYRFDRHGKQVMKLNKEDFQDETI